jgi:hypothetical protein
MNRDVLRALIREARRQGWTVELTGSGHWRFVSPKDGERIFTSGSSSDVRAIWNHRARMRRHGFQG